MKKNSTKRWIKGYTLAELLAAVAILVILMAIAVPAILTIRRNVRQRALDNKAEVIYTAVQNNLTKLRGNGNAESFSASKATELNVIPADMDSDGDDELYYVISNDKENSANAAGVLVTSDTLDADLYSHYWVVEYNPTSASVYAVFYSETRSDYTPSSYNSLRYKKNRLVDGARVGYYGGDSVEADTTTALAPKVTINNEEKLQLVITCKRPDENPLSFDVELSDTEGHIINLVYGTDSTGKKLVHKKDDLLSADSSKLKENESGEIRGAKYTLTITLDALNLDGETGSRFVELYGQDNGYLANNNKGLTPGTALTVKVTAHSTNSLVDGMTVTAATNSLFGDGSTDTEAEILYGRHLQNLDIGSSKVTDKITSAVQKSDIDFKKESNNTADTTEDTSSWYSCYKDLTFVPITNGNLTSYKGDLGSEGQDSSLCVINHLTTKTSDKAGLFAIVPDGMTISNVALSGASIIGNSEAGSYAGGFVAYANGALSLNNCRLYLDESDIKGKTEKNLWIKNAATEGGLVGYAEGKVTIKNSLAATVMGGTNTSMAGGLIGEAEGGADIVSSYADSYVSGKQVGGLIAKSDGATSINASYSVGYLTAGTVAGGFIAGGSGTVTMKNSYTAVSWYSTGTTAAEIVRYSTVPKKDGSTASNTYFLQVGTDYREETAENKAVGTKITYTSLSSVTKMSAALNNGETYFVSAATTNAYNLKDQGLSGYSYPEISGLPHYGDWQADFEAGSLVYYEVYKDASGNISYGFYGGNITPSLRNDLTVIGDGYGVVYDESDKPTTDFYVTYQSANSNGTVTEPTQAINPSETSYSVTVSGSAYLIYPLPAEIVNSVPIGSNYYQKITVRGASAVGGSGTDTNAEDGNVFYYNPHFAKTVTNAPDAGKTITTPATISIRTARQLYSLSKYYDNYKLATQKSTFTQELDIYYDRYEWATYYNAGINTISVQTPIGVSMPFIATYDGGCHIIDGISFMSNRTKIGLFGENSGTIQNVFLASDYVKGDATNPYLSYSGNIENNKTVYMGALAGVNRGKISNCAVSGFYVAGASHTMYVRENGTLYFGGLVGSNSGTVSNCEVDTPLANANILYGKAYIGGFAGENTSQGRITNCYSVGKLTVEYSKGENSDMSGFTAKNAGSILNSYCAVTMTSAGSTTTYAFAKRGGSITDCTYLGGGTLTYLGSMEAFDNTDGSGSMKTFIDMKTGSGSTARANSATTASTGYPFRTVVTDANGQGVHFGNWQTASTLGKFGILYWEKEESGSNNGYHFSYIGYYKDENGNLQKSNGSTLCKEHDDGGIITEYGYAYYYASNAGEAPKMEAKDFQIGNKNEEASEALTSRLNGFTVVAYTTAPAIQQSKNATESYMKMTSGAENGVWTLTETLADKTTKEYSFTLNPFFADAMQYGTENSTETPMPGETGNEYEIRSAEQLQYINWNSSTGDAITTLDSKNYNTYVNYYTYLGKELASSSGSSSTSSEISYIWTGDEAPEQQKYVLNSNTTCSHKSGGRNSKAIDYYVDVTVNSTNYWEFVEDSGSTTSYEVTTWSYKSINDGSFFNINYRYHYTFTTSTKTGYWKWVGSGKPTDGTTTWTKNGGDTDRNGELSFLQSHDVDADMTPNGDKLFTQIGSLYDENGKYDTESTIVYAAYFTGSYDGNTYSIKNIEIKSCNALIGLFGAIVGGNVQNVTLYSENGNYIQRTETSTASKSWYAIGGLCGLAGTGTGDGAKYSTITNCTVSGYTICDNSICSSWGDGNIGGMLGISTMDILNCTAVNTIKLNTVFRTSKTDAGYKGDGVSLRTGGLVGSMRGTLTNSYTGGEIVISDECYENAQYSCGSKIFLGGLTGGIYLKSGGNLGTMLGSEIQGFSGYKSSENDVNNTSQNYNQKKCEIATQTIENCYTYIKMPCDKIDRIKSISPIGSNGETPDENYTNCHVRVKIENCYYYENNIPKTKEFTNEKSNGNTNIDTTPVGLTWEEMQTTLFEKLSDAGFTAVTSQENGQSVDGKYTFPGNNTSLDGENYPLPTILTQTTSGGTVRVHYGEWPNNGIYWERSRASMDIFESLLLDDGDYKGKSIQTFILNGNGKIGTDLTFDEFSFSYGSVTDDETVDGSESGTDTGSDSESGTDISGDDKTSETDESETGSTEPIAKVIDIKYAGEAGGYVATVEAYKTGTETITVTVGDQSAEFALTVSADIAAYVSEDSVIMEKGNKATFSLFVLQGDSRPVESTNADTGKKINSMPANVRNLAPYMTWVIQMDKKFEEAEYLEVSNVTTNESNSEFTITCNNALDEKVTLTVKGTYTYQGVNYTVHTEVTVNKPAEAETPEDVSGDDSKADSVSDNDLKADSLSGDNLEAGSVSGNSIVTNDMMSDDSEDATDSSKAGASTEEKTTPADGESKTDSSQTDATTGGQTTGDNQTTLPDALPSKTDDTSETSDETSDSQKGNSGASNNDAIVPKAVTDGDEGTQPEENEPAE